MKSIKKFVGSAAVAVGLTMSVGALAHADAPSYTQAAFDADCSAANGVKARITVDGLTGHVELVKESSYTSTFIDPEQGWFTAASIKVKVGSTIPVARGVSFTGEGSKLLPGSRTASYSVGGDENGVTKLAVCIVPA